MVYFMSYLKNYFKTIKNSLGFLFLMGITSPVFAMDSSHLTEGLGTIATITQDFGVAMGVCLFITCLFKFKRYGEARTMMSYQHTAIKPLVMLFCSVCLMCLPLFMQTMLLALWGSSSPLAYPDFMDANENAMMQPLIQFARLVGIMGVMRGLMLLSRAGGEQGQPGGVGKAVLHIIGGLLCVNIYTVYELLYDLFN